VSTASPVPETWSLTGDDARETLRRCGRWSLVRDAFVRLRAADGFTHARALAYVTALVLVEGIIALVGFANAFGGGGASRAIVRTLKAAVPGPGGRVLTDAVSQAHRAGSSHRYLALTFGLLAAVLTGSTLMGQVERALNRIYGIEKDRPSLQKYGLALLLTLTAGALTSIAFAVFAFGRVIGDAIHNDGVAIAWTVLRWPLALVLITVAISLLFRYSPRRHQPGLSWLGFGATVAVVAWVLCTVGLGLFFTASKSFGQTYGPLAGLIGLLVWALLSSTSLLVGGAVSAQLEAVRAGATTPQDEQKIEHSEPEAASTEARSRADTPEPSRSKALSRP
jgi:YihY family inner membrane protein